MAPARGRRSGSQLRPGCTRRPSARSFRRQASRAVTQVRQIPDECLSALPSSSWWPSPSVLLRLGGKSWLGGDRVVGRISPQARTSLVFRAASTVRVRGVRRPSSRRHLATPRTDEALGRPSVQPHRSRHVRVVNYDLPERRSGASDLARGGVLGGAVGALMLLRYGGAFWPALPLSALAGCVFGWLFGVRLFRERTSRDH